MSSRHRGVLALAAHLPDLAVHLLAQVRQLESTADVTRWLLMPALATYGLAQLLLVLGVLARSVRHRPPTPHGWVSSDSLTP